MHRAVLAIGFTLLLPHLLWSQAPPRICGPVVEARRVVLKGSVRALARAEFDLGPVDPGRQIGPVVILLKQSAEQQAALAKLLDDQADPASPRYRQWLTPEQYGERFGADKGDIAVIGSWLESYGLKVETPARGHGWVAFSGAARDIQTALGTQIHRYRIGLGEHFANATAVSIPEALALVAGAFMGLDDLYARPRYTNTDGSHGLAPGDIDTIYDIAPLHAAGIDGTGQQIAIVGDSAIDLSDLRNFRGMFNLPPNDPQVVLFGSDPGVNDDMGEADEDIEWSNAVAPNATVVYTYAASGPFEAAIYAVDQDLAPVLSESFTGCEEEDVDFAGPFRAIAQQANAQGMTWMNAAGDAGAAGCDWQVVNPIATRGLAVTFPSSFPEITAMGGTEFDEGNGNYWSGTNAPGGGSALSYIPETAWNDTAALGALAAGGGGRSVVYAKPAWQDAPGVPNDNFRDVPDLALAASWYHDAYWLCTIGDCGIWTGGTSAASPLMAGIVTLVNQALVAKKVLAQPGLGNINPVLYRMARNTTDVFHDITTGNNIVPCLATTSGCVKSELGYNAGPGYDLATGLGSVDAFNLVNEWDTRAPVTVTISGYSASLSLSDNTPITATVTTTSGGPAPTGTITFLRGNGPSYFTNLAAPVWLGDSPLAGDTAPMQLYGGQLSAGANTILASYSGDQNYNSAFASVTITGTVPAGHSAVAITLGCNPCDQYPLLYGYNWFPQVTLTEEAGIGTTVTGLNIGDLSFPTQGVIDHFGSASLAAYGSLTATFGYTGTNAQTILVSAFGMDASGYAWNQQANLRLGVFSQVAEVNAGGFVNAASLQAGFAPGELVKVTGGGLAISTVQVGSSPLPLTPLAASSFPLPLTLGESSVTIDGVPAPFLYASPDELILQIPYETAPGTGILAVTNSGFQETGTYSFPVAAAAPGIFPPGASVTPGQAATILITGAGVASPFVATGETPAPGTPQANLPQPILPVSLTVAGLPAGIQSIGIPSGYAGIVQIVCTVPYNTPAGVQPMVVQVGTAFSPAAYVTVVANGWRLVWSDEFNGAAGSPPDPANWNFDLGGGGWGNGELETYTDSIGNAFQDGNGNLVISAIQDASGNYTSARLQTGGPGASSGAIDDSWQYGLLEARIKLPYGTGVWPAFRMLGEDGPGEVDIMDNFGTFDNNAFVNNGTVYGPGYLNPGITAAYALPFGEQVDDDYHVYAAQWSPNSIAFLVDGIPYATVTPDNLPGGAQWVFNIPFFLLLDVAIGGPATFLGTPDASVTFPQDMLVDYVRVYQPVNVPATTPVITPGRVVNAASYLGAISPGSLAVVYGNNLADAEHLIPVPGPGGNFPITVAGVTVSVNGVNAPLVYVSPTQINFQVPWETVPGPAVNVQVTWNSASSNVEPVTIAATASPSFFLSEFVNGVAWVTGNVADGCATPTTECSVQANSTYQLWANGLGPMTSPLQDGVPAPLAAMQVPGGPSACQLTIGGQPATVVYCGAAPGEIIDQVNFTYPAGVTASAPYVGATLTIDGVTGYFRVPAPAQ